MSTKSHRAWGIHAFQDDDHLDLGAHLEIHEDGRELEDEHPDVVVTVREGVSRFVVNAAMDRLYDLLEPTRCEFRAPTVKEVDFLDSLERRKPPRVWPRSA